MQNQYEQFKILSRVILSDTECDNIISTFDNDLEYKQQQEHRSVYIKDINIIDIPYLKDTVISANETYYKFDLNYNKVDCFFARYNTGMHYQQLHMDCIAGNVQRKLSFSLQLNDSFSGGEFTLLQNSTLKTTKGKLNIFPSFLPHAVTPVTSGTRYVIFGWFYGPNFI